MKTLSTAESLESISKLLDLENGIYSPDFQAGEEGLKHWSDYGTFFCSSVLNKQGAPLSIGSLLVTSRKSMIDLMAGKITESELRAWNPFSIDEPIYYFASLILDSPLHAKPIFSSLLRDISSAMSSWSSMPRLAFAIGCTESGVRYLECENFHATGKAYMDHYPFFLVDRASASRGLLSRAFKSKRFQPASPAAASCPPHTEPLQESSTVLELNSSSLI